MLEYGFNVKINWVSVVVPIKTVFANPVTYVNYVLTDIYMCVYIYIYIKNNMIWYLQVSCARFKGGS